MSNLRLINETIVDSFVTSVNITDIFSSDFDVYKIIISDTEGNSIPATDLINLRSRFINISGSVVSASEYDNANFLIKAESTSDNDSQTNATYFYGRDNIGDYTSSGSVTYIMNPFLSSSFTFMIGQGSGGYNTANSRFRSNKQIGVLTEFSTITGINFFSSNSSYSFKGRFITYGLRVDT